MALIPINITGGFYKSRSLPLSAQVTRNMYPEIQENPATKDPYILQSFPGYSLFSQGFDLVETEGVTFDGSNDYLTRGADLTSLSNGRIGTVAMRIRIDDGDGANRYIYEGATSGVDIFLDTANKLNIRANNTAGNSVKLLAKSTTAYTAGATWLNVLCSWNGTTDTDPLLYINDSDDLDAASSESEDEDYKYSTTEHSVGAQVNGSSKFDGDIEFLYINFTEKVLISTEANRRLFFDSRGAPVSLGADGSTPTGTAPHVYLSGALATWHTNKGTGGGFTVTGTLTAATSVTFPATAERGSFDHQEVLYSVLGTSLYSVSSAGVKTELGSGGEILGTDPCILDGIGDNVVVVTEGKVFVWDGSTVDEVTDPDLETPNGVAHLNNQVIYDGDDGRFASSDVGDASSISGLNYATAESNADDLLRPYVLNQTLYLMGTRTIEQWWNSGSGSPPFDRIEGGIIPIGLKAIYSVADNGDTMFFLGHDLKVYAVSGSNYQVISTIPISNAIEGYSTVSDAEGTYFTFQGQNFYQLTFPQSDKSWLYCISSNEWVENSSGDSGGRAIFNHAVNVYNKVIVADWSNGNLYELDVDTFDENGDTIIRLRDTGVLHGGLFGAPGKWIEMNRLELLCETGVGNLTTTPQIMLSWSDDGGRTFSTEAWGTVNIGTAGNYQVKIEWFSLGGFYNRILRFRMSEAVRWTLYSAAADIEVGI